MKNESGEAESQETGQDSADAETLAVEQTGQEQVESVESEVSEQPAEQFQETIDAIN